MSNIINKININGVEYAVGGGGGDREPILIGLDPVELKSYTTYLLNAPQGVHFKVINKRTGSTVVDGNSALDIYGMGILTIDENGLIVGNSDRTYSLNWNLYFKGLKGTSSSDGLSVNSIGGVLPLNGFSTIGEAAGAKDTFKFQIENITSYTSSTIKTYFRRGPNLLIPLYTLSI